jgi:hypothetical protein
MPETWEVLTLRGLAATDERAEEFTGTLVLHREGSPEPVESISIRVKRSVLGELHDVVGRLLARSIGFKPGRPSPRRS